MPSAKPIGLFIFYEVAYGLELEIRNDIIHKINLVLRGHAQPHSGGNLCCRNENSCNPTNQSHPGRDVLFQALHIRKTKSEICNAFPALGETP
ncbi:MAG: hypothetical protein ACE5GL_01660 [Calditrichia bacterium]